MEKIIQLAKKLLALAEKGVDGEAENALNMLHKLMQQHGITMDMINENDVKEHHFYVEKEKYKIWRQVVASVLGNSTVSYYKGERKKKKSYFIKCTPAEALEIQAKFDFYWAAWEKELKTFTSAFIQKNKLYQKPDENDEKEDRELTPEELDELYRLYQMMGGIQRHHFVKQLEN